VVCPELAAAASASGEGERRAGEGISEAGIVAEVLLFGARLGPKSVAEEYTFWVDEKSSNSIVEDVVVCLVEMEVLSLGEECCPDEGVI
jgi:hypothetical protein